MHSAICVVYIKAQIYVINPKQDMIGMYKDATEKRKGKATSGLFFHQIANKFNFTSTNYTIASTVSAIQSIIHQSAPGLKKKEKKKKKRGNYTYPSNWHPTCNHPTKFK